MKKIFRWFWTLCSASVLMAASSAIAPAQTLPPPGARPSNPPSLESLQNEPQPERPQIVWHKRMANGVDLGVVSEPDTLDGKPVRSLSPYSVRPKEVANDDTYYGELPAKVRGDTPFVHFILHGTPRPDPDQGTVLNIDGAVIGFIAKHDAKSGRDFAQLAAQAMGPDGTIRWMPLGFLLPSKPQQRVSLPRLAVRFNRDDNTWALYLKDVILREGLPLLSDGDSPTVSVRAGLAGDTARLMDLRIAKEPPPRGQRPIAAENGRIDLKKEYESGNPRVKASGLPADQGVNR